MGRVIIKIHDDRDNRDYYMEWSEVVDAPVTYGMNLEMFKDYYRKEYGENGMRGLPERLERVEYKGTSSTVEDGVDIYFILNRAGEGETLL